jgi:hypothetical protein
MPRLIRAAVRNGRRPAPHQKAPVPPRRTVRQRRSDAAALKVAELMCLVILVVLVAIVITR